MKKTWSIFLIITCLTFVLALPAFAEGNNQGTNDGMVVGTPGTSMNMNNYRTNAATDDRNFDWGWLGLIGLAGLAGLRRKNPERT
ncbi:MAG: hypothetical protein K0R67_618 [Paenibacillus sp.]|jgi:MYXO-CTERM domain-containing protein|nr:hypothetical protein [Paenibacillus sp.]